MFSTSTTDVLIVGAGPAGLMCAYIISQAGLDVRVVDRRLDRLLAGQADVIQARGIEILDSINLASKIIPTAHQLYAVSTYKGDPDGSISRVSKVEFNFGVESRFRFTVNHSQSFIEGVFRNALTSGDSLIRGMSFRPDPEPQAAPRKVIVEQGTYPTRLVLQNGLDSEHLVEVELENAQGAKEVVRAKYVIGCDGAHSWTRAQLGIDMVGDNFDFAWGLIDIAVDTNFPDIRNLTIVENNGRRAVIVPRENDTVRFNVQLMESEIGKDPTTGRVNRAQVSEVKLRQIIKDVFKPYRIDFVGETLWYTIYVIGQRLASTYEGANGRVFIAGDACHTHSPHAGQGMNAAMSDGHNLSWKLVHVLRGWASTELLRTYEVERRAFAKDLVELHERIAQAMSGKVKGTNAEIMSKSMGFVSGASVQYQPTCITHLASQALATGIPIGQRMPHQVILRAADSRPYSTHDLLKCDFRYTLLLFVGDIKLPARSKALSTFLEGIGHDRVTFKIFTILLAKKETCEYVDVPEAARSHWDTVFVDDIAYTASDGGGTAYQSLGIGSEGCAVVVRPDGHAGMIAALDANGAGKVEKFFEFK